MLILIGGGSCSGKTTFARALAEHLQIPLIHLDTFFRRDDPDGPKITVDGTELFDCNHPETIDLAKALKEIDATPNPKIVEGHFALTYPELRDRSTIKIFVDCPPETREQRRLARDTEARKGTPAQILAYYRTCAVPGFEKYIAPSRAHADWTLDGSLEPQELLRQALTKIPARTSSNP